MPTLLRGAARPALIRGMPRVADIEILEDLTATARCDEGFLRLRRYKARNRRADGSLSSPYPIDVIERATLDAVALCVHARSREGVVVLTRRQLRPAALFRRGRPTALPEPEHLLVEEVLAGVVEPGEAGEASLRARAAAEALEEAGLVVDPAALTRLGAPFFLVPGVASELVHLYEVEVADPATRGPLDAPSEGDGSPLEEGAVLEWRELSAALRACDEGAIADAKTEVALRRLAARLGGGGDSTLRGAAAGAASRRS
jgi:ADP-ribose pyrophosphatase